MQEWVAAGVVFFESAAVQLLRVKANWKESVSPCLRSVPKTYLEFKL